MGRASVPTPALYPAFFFVLGKAAKGVGNAVIPTFPAHCPHGLQHLRYKRLTFASADKSGYTLGFPRKIAHSGTHAERGGVSDGALSLPSARSARSRTSPGRVSERHTLPLLGLGRGCSQRTQRASGQRCAYACRCPEGVAAPLGCVIFLQFGDVAVFSLCTQYFTQNFLRVQDEGGITTLVLLRVLLKRWTAACQKGSFAAFCDEICQG